MTQAIESLRRQLDQVNQETAQLISLDPLNLAYQMGEAEQDTLFLYGIVGGKDVGKTTLINQLAGSRISIDTDILDEGTKVAVAYCHRLDVPILKKRLAAEINERLLYVPHDRQELKNVVLLDFPDFDSRFLKHRDDVQRLGKYLQGIVWTITPRKYADHEFIEQLEAVAQSNENYFVALNKIDQLEQKTDPEKVREEVFQYLTKECAKRNIPLPDRRRFWLLSALSPQRFDFPELHSRLIRIHSPEEIAKAKVKNLRAEFEKNLARMEAYYSLGKKMEEISTALETIRQDVADQFSETYFASVCKRIGSLESLRRRVSRAVFARRIEGWPILRSLFYPLAGVVSALGGRWAFVDKTHEGEETPKELLRFEGITAFTRMHRISEKLNRSYPLLAQNLGEAADYSSAMEREFQRLLQEHEQQVIDQLLEEISTPKRYKKVLMFLPILWFPFLQPFLLLLGKEPGNRFSLAGLYDLFLNMVSLLGAGNLLESAVFLVFFYVGCLIFFYADCTRRVQNEGQEEFRFLWYNRFLPWITEALSAPLVEYRAQILEKSTQLSDIRKQINLELERIANS